MFALAVGSGMLATQLMAAGAVFGLRRWVIGSLLLANAVATAGELNTLLRYLCRGWRGLRVVIFAGWRPAIIALSVTGAVLLAPALAPPSDWDSLMYHILVPAQWVSDGRISTLDGNEHVAVVGLVHFLYVPLVAIGSNSGPAVLSAALALVLGVTIFLLGRMLFGATTANYALVLLWGTPIILLVGWTAKVDASLTLFLLLAHLALVAACIERSSQSHMDLAAVMSGMAVGTKYLAGLYLLGLIPLVIVGARRTRGAWTLGRYGLIALIVASPWLLKNQVLFGAPFYPIFGSHQPQEWLRPFLAPGAVVGSLDPRLLRVQAVARDAFNIRDAFVNPRALGVGGETAFYFMNPLLILSPLLLLKVREVRYLAVGVPAMVYAAVLLATFPEINLRYLLPAIVPLTIACTAVAVGGTEALPILVRSTLRCLLVLVSLIPSIGTVYFWLAGTEALGNLAGLHSGAEYLSTHISRPVRSHARVTAAANELLPPHSKVLMVYESRGLYLNARAIEDTRLTNWPALAAVLGPGRCIEGSGITHVLARPATARAYEARGVPVAVLGRLSFQNFAERCLTPLYTDSDVTLYVNRPEQRVVDGREERACQSTVDACSEKGIR